MVSGSRLALTLVASGLLALLFQGGCAQSSAIDLPPDAGNGSTSTGGQLGTGGAPGTGGLRATGGTGGTPGTGGITSTGGTAGMRATGGSAGTGGSGGAAAATFTQIYQTILTTTCTGSQCHSPGKQGGVNFASQSSAYTSLKSRVVAGDAEASSFYALLNAGVMPPTGNNLTSDQLALIAAWINGGATNN
jgi:predicted CxxxxCH...CXXCH cytochrome family protein